jgi:hypothetical protein
VFSIGLNCNPVTSTNGSRLIDKKNCYKRKKRRKKEKITKKKKTTKKQKQTNQQDYQKVLGDSY